MWANIQTTTAIKKYHFYVINHVFSTLQEALDTLSVTISMHVMSLHHWQVLSMSLFVSHTVLIISDSNISCSFADTVSGAGIGLQAHSWNPEKNPLWVLPRMCCYTTWILFSWSVYFRLFWTSKQKENTSLGSISISDELGNFSQMQAY